MNFLIKITIFVFGVYLSYSYLKHQKISQSNEYYEKGNEFFFQKRYLVIIIFLIKRMLRNNIHLLLNIIKRSPLIITIELYQDNI
jgi:hypothetical protein